MTKPSPDFGYELFRVLLVVGLALLMFFGAFEASAGERKLMKVFEDGEHGTLLDPGECDGNGCVLYEKYVEEWDGKAKWVHQFIDRNGNGICDIVVIFKPLVDPKHGTYYTIFTTKDCGGMI